MSSAKSEQERPCSNALSTSSASAKSVPRIAPSVCSETTPFAGEEGEVNYRENRFVRLCFLLFLHVFCVCAFCGMRSAGASSVPHRNFNLRIRHKSLNLKTSRFIFLLRSRANLILTQLPSVPSLFGGSGDKNSHLAEKSRMRERLQQRL